MPVSSRAAKRAAKKARKKQLLEKLKQTETVLQATSKQILTEKEAQDQKAKKEQGKSKREDGAHEPLQPGAPEEVAVKQEEELKPGEVVVYEREDLTQIDLPPEFASMASVFHNFQKLTESNAEKSDDDIEEQTHEEKTKVEEDQGEGEQMKKKGKLSRRERRLKAQENIAILKQSVDRPELIELHDCNSHDPHLLVFLKAYRNAVPVPDHVFQKRKYLQNKRGVEKQPFELPDYIAATGITKIRQAQQDKSASQNAKQAAKSRVNPNMGRMDIDYQILHDAIFRNQTKPKLTGHGDLYHEGKEFQVRLKSRQPGDLSDDLMRALGMTLGKQSPPPWLFNMQRWGPPPTYTALEVPGVNAPIPEGCRYGYGENEWGAPPQDEFGRPLYGDVFGTVKKDDMNDGFDRSLWGTIVEDEESSDDDESSDEEEDDEEQEDMGGTLTTESTMTGVGTATPHALQLRKAQDGAGLETPTAAAPQKSLYTILEEKKTSVQANELFGTSRTYVLPTAAAGSEGLGAGQFEAKRPSGQVEVTLNPDELEGLDAATLKRKYDNQMAQVQGKTASQRAEIAAVAQEEMQKRKKRKTDKSKNG